MSRAQEWIVEYAPSNGDGTWGAWQLCWNAVCEQIVEYAGARPSLATISLQGLLWHETGGLQIDDRVCVRTPGVLAASTVLFDGVITAWQPSFSGGMAGAEGYEKSTFLAQDFRYLLHITSKIKGQFGWSVYDYPLPDHSGWGGVNPPDPSSYGGTFDSGRRCVFNEKGQPNQSPDWLTFGNQGFDGPVFGYLQSIYWTVRNMVVYCLGEAVCEAMYRGYGPQHDPLLAVGLADADWDTVVNDVVVEGRSPIEAAEYLAGLIGWKYRMDNYLDGGTVKQRHVFYQPAVAAGPIRSASQPTRRHWLYAPNNYGSLYPTSDTIQTLRDDPAVNLLWQADMMIDAAAAANVSVGLGERSIYEITAELVPAWPDSQLTLDWVDEANDRLYMLDEDFKAMLEVGMDPNTESTYYNRYHASGSAFGTYCLVGRKWALNEVGTYSTPTYDRGGPFDFSTVIPGLDTSRLGYFRRQVLPCLGRDDADGDVRPVQYKLEYSLDGGTHWHPMDGRYSLLDAENSYEWGVYITQPSLADIVPKSTTDEGPGTYPANEEGQSYKTADQEINFWTALAREIDLSRSFKAGAWQLKVRLTACVQLDQRLLTVRDAIAGSGTCFKHEAVFDYSRQYLQRQRTPSSVLGRGENPFPAAQRDHLEALAAHLDLVTELNRQQSQSCSFTLLGIKPAEGSGAWRTPRFALGDTIAGIEGRGVSLRTNRGGDREEFVTIEQIIYSPESDTMSIVTSDLRKSRIQ